MVFSMAFESPILVIEKLMIKKRKSSSRIDIGATGISRQDLVLNEARAESSLSINKIAVDKSDHTKIV